MKTVSERIAALPQEQRALLLQRLKQQVSQPVNTSFPFHGSSDAWVVRYRQNEQARLRLFCFPYAGGGASIFRSWSDMLPTDIEVCAIQLPGRENRMGEPAYKRIVPLVEALAESLFPYLDRPFAFYGHSMGALVSFELARLLSKRHGKLPICMYLAAYRAPQLPNPHIKIYHLPEEVFKVVLRADGIPEMILQNEELMQVMLPTLRADFELCDTYLYEEEKPLDCPLLIFGGLEDVRISAADLEGWTIHSSVSSCLSLLPGSHFFLHSAQELLLTGISQDLKARLNLLEQQVL